MDLDPGGLRWDPSSAVNTVGNIAAVLRGDLLCDRASGLDSVVKLNHTERDPASSSTPKGLFLQLHPDKGRDPANLQACLSRCTAASRVKELHL